MSSLLTSESKQKNYSNPFRIRIFLFLSFSFGIGTINTFIHSAVPSKTIPVFRPKRAKTLLAPCENIRFSSLFAVGGEELRIFSQAKPYRCSLSIRRFWGKGERWKRKRERGEGRPDTQATTDGAAHTHGIYKGVPPGVLNKAQTVPFIRACLN